MRNWLKNRIYLRSVHFMSIQFLHYVTQLTKRQKKHLIYICIMYSDHRFLKTSHSGTDLGFSENQALGWG